MPPPLDPLVRQKRRQGVRYRGHRLRLCGGAHHHLDMLQALRAVFEIDLRLR